MRTLSFAGREWEVRSGVGGPRANRWSDSPGSARVDDDGRLHLAIREESGVWHAAEVTAREPAGYGEYRFRVDCDLQRLDPGVVAGLFVYADDRNEIDIEIASFSDDDVDAPPLLHHTHQHPYRTSAAPPRLSGTFTTHRLVWTPERVEWQSWHGHHDRCPPGHLILRSGHRGPTASPEGARLKLNLWLLRPDAGPVRGRPAEVVIRDVRFRAMAPEP